MTDNDVYYRRRIEEELDAAKSAADSSISRIHVEIARRYRDLLDDPAARDPGTAVA